MGFFRLQCWSGLPFPTPGNLPHPGIKLVSLLSVERKGTRGLAPTVGHRGTMSGCQDKVHVLPGLDMLPASDVKSMDGEFVIHPQLPRWLSG